MTVMLVLAGFGLGCLVGEVDARRQRKGWKPYRPSTNPLRDYK